MSITPGILPRDLGSPLARQPLSIRTTSPTLTSTLKQVRRKNSFIRHADSSEEPPSPHESIFEAFYFSGANSDESNNRIELISLLPNGAPVWGNNENRGPSTPPPAANPLDDVQFRYGHGTILDAIPEQKSGKTNRTVSRTKSLDNMAGFPFLTHRDSFVLSRTPRRKLSFSLDDMALVNRYYHDACTTIEKETCRTLPVIVSEIYAQPKKPLHAPPDRPSTPPGMPSWTAAQNLPPRGRTTHEAPRQSRFQRFFGFPGSGLTISSRIPTSTGQLQHRDRVASSPVRGRTAPRFRPPRSVYGPLDQHPFARAPVACVVTGAPDTTAQVEVAPEPSMAEVRRQKSKLRRHPRNRVRFTPSATARDSENIALASAFEATSTQAVHPLTPIPLPIQPQITPVKKLCKHQLSRLQNDSVNNDNNFPPSISYENLTEDSPVRPPHTPTMGPRQSLSPSLSRVTASTGSPFNRHDLDEINLAPTPEPDRSLGSAHSGAPLMSGALRQSLLFTPDMNIERGPEVFGGVEEAEVKQEWCWRCKVDEGCRMLDSLWVSGLGVLGFWCCGFDSEEEEEVGAEGFGINGGVGVMGGERLPPSRRVSLGTQAMV